MTDNAKQRALILAYLYAERETAPRRGWVKEWDIVARFGDAGFALDVLAETGLIKQDGPLYRILGAGVLAYEAASAA